MSTVDDLKIAIIKGDENTAFTVLDSEYMNITFSDFLNALSEAMIEVGKKYKTGEYFIPEMLVSSQLTGDLYEIYCKKRPDAFDEFGPGKSVRIVFGTVHGDIHSIGKDIIVKALSCCGIDIRDLGINVTQQKFDDAITEFKPDIVMMSAFSTATRRNLHRILLHLKEKYSGLKYFIGGAAVNKEYAQEIGADCYCENIVEIIEYLKNK